ncbi:MAG: ribonuclease H-like domain-containing protein [Anaerolineales bacterium]|nr:ribonuclease H-like domain-containing protein [Anaerolineales bacterium]
MSSLSDRFRQLGVQLGGESLAQRQKHAKYPIETLVDGRFQVTPVGEAFLVEKLYPLADMHGNTPLQLISPVEMLAAWAKDERVATCSTNGYAFLDTETTGLGGASGTFAFLVGVGRFEVGGFRLAQFFMRDPAEEAAMLTALDGFLDGCETIVSFNGKSFDVPLLNTRYVMQGTLSPLRSLAQLDLLHLARRLWRERLPSRTLGNLEVEILGLDRSEEDVPGWMIPQMYFDYVRSGDARPMKSVLYHNAIDILSMVTLMEIMAGMLAEPLAGENEHTLDMLAVGRLYEDLGYLDKAALIIEQTIERGLPDEHQTAAIERLGYIHKRRGDTSAALSLWWQAAADRQIYAHVELAKYYEHREKNLLEAKRWTQAALAIINAPGYPRFERQLQEPELTHRLNRLERKLARGEEVDEDEAEE